MGFLEKLKTNILKQRGSSFKEAIQKEKKKKYLFTTPTQKGSRKGSFGIFRKKGNPRSGGLSQYVLDTMERTRKFAQGQELFMKWIGLFLIVTTIYIVLYSPYFLLSPSKVVIESLDESVDESIARESIRDFYGKNIFFLDETKLAKIIQSYQRNISSIKIDMLYPNNLKILLTGQKSIFTLMITSIPGKKYGLTEYGVLIPEEKIDALPGGPKILLIDTTLSEDDIIDYKELFGKEEVDVMQKMLRSFEDIWKDIEIEGLVYMKKENELHLLLKNKSRILFTLENIAKKSGEDIDYSHLSRQFLAMKIFIESRYENMKNGTYTYIDARIPDRIFSCRDPSICRKNLITLYPDIELYGEK